MSTPSSGPLSKVLEKVGRRRNNPVVKVAADGARALLRGFEGNRAVLRDMARNGEARVLQQLRGSLDVVFDVGANVGDWSQHALDAGAGTIHAFEISPATSARLSARYESNDKVNVNTFGLSNAPGTITIHHYPDHPTLTTMTEYPHDARSEAIDVPVRTGDDYLAEHGIASIDFMKLDVEGAEELVIAGFAKAFAAGAISVVQIEYGKVSILTKYLLRDFYTSMTGYGFRVGRITPDRVEFMPYELDMETFEDSNWLAVHAGREDLISKLG